MQYSQGGDKTEDYELFDTEEGSGEGSDDDDDDDDES